MCVLYVNLFLDGSHSLLIYLLSEWGWRNDHRMAWISGTLQGIPPTFSKTGIDSPKFTP